MLVSHINVGKFTSKFFARKNFVASICAFRFIGYERKTQISVIGLATGSNYRKYQLSHTETSLSFSLICHFPSLRSLFILRDKSHTPVMCKLMEWIWFGEFGKNLC